MLPLETPLAGRRKAGILLSPPEDKSHLPATDGVPTTENDFGRIMDRAKAPELEPNQKQQGHRPTNLTNKINGPKAASNRNELTVQADADDTGDEANSVDSNSKLPNQTTASLPKDSAPTTDGSEAVLAVTVNPPMPVLNTLPLAPGFGCGVETATADDAEATTQTIDPLNIPSPALVSGNLVEKPFAGPTTSNPTPPTTVPISSALSETPHDGGSAEKTNALDIANLTPLPSSDPIKGNPMPKPVAGKTESSATSTSGAVPKQFLPLQPKTDGRVSAVGAVGIPLPPVDDENAVAPDLESTVAKENVSPAIAPTLTWAATAKNMISNSGTGVATDAGVMKKAEKQTEVAGLGEKVLPGGKVDPSPGLQMRAALGSAHNSESLKPDVSISLTTTHFGSPIVMETAKSFTLPSLAETQLRTVERTAEMMTFHVTRLAKSDTESMQVVIRPGAGTELSLELRQRNGEVEVHATLQRGDYQALNQHWPELQERMEQRGVKLTSLGSEANNSLTGGSNFSRQQHSQREEVAQQASAFAEFTMAMNRGGATARLATTTPGANEWWA